MPSKRRTSSPKQLDRSSLSKQAEITITIASTEANIHRIHELLLFADLLAPEPKPLPPLPWEDPDDPRYQQPPELEIDYDAVRRSIVKQLEPYVKTHSKQQAQAMLKEFGGERLRDVPEKNLVALDTALGLALKLVGHTDAP